jgi:poly(A) polymerase
MSPDEAAKRERRARDICRTLREAGHEALFAGGCVRDMLLEQDPKDYDIATSALPEDVDALFEKVIPVGAAFGVQQVMTDVGPFEVAAFRSDGPYLDGRRPSYVEFTNAEEDARRRDFTVNAMFYDPLGEEVLDYVGGQADLEAQVVRAVGDAETRFQEDYLRLMRAVRFAARLGFDIETSTFEAMKRCAPKILGTSAERIRDELVKMLTEGAADRAFRLMDECGLLEQVLPEVAQMKGVEQPPKFHPEGDVYVHTLLLLAAMEHPTPTLALGALLHDVGKPVTQTFEDRIRFNNHDKIGADMARAICSRLRMSNEQRRRVGWLVENHMRLAHVPKMKESRRKRFVREKGFDELVELGRLDAVASHGRTDLIDWIREYEASLGPEEVAPEPLLKGQDLIDMGYEPGPRFGEILQAVEEAQLEDELTTPEEAKAFVRERWSLE